MKTVPLKHLIYILLSQLRRPRTVCPLWEKLAAALEQYVYAYAYAHTHTELQRAMDELKTATS
jgi:hypothetical protein